MVLSYEQVKDITFGAIDILRQEDGIHFAKCSSRQIEAWYKLRNDLGERAETTTGVTIDFHTNTRSVEFSVIGNKFELLIDGVLTQQVMSELEMPRKESVICQELSEGEHRITFIFPSHDIGVLRRVTVDDDSYVLPHKFDKKILFIGDSITQGWDSKFECMSFAYRVADFYNAEHVINGIGGAIYHPSTFDKVNFDPDMVVVAYGTNDYDYYGTFQEFRENMSSYLELVRQAYDEKKVFVILPIRRFDLTWARDVGTFEDCRTAIQRECKKQGFEVVDGYKLVPPMASFYADVVHPNDLGFSVYAEKLIGKMNEGYA